MSAAVRTFDIEHRCGLLDVAFGDPLGCAGPFDLGGAQRRVGQQRDRGALVPRHHLFHLLLAFGSEALEVSDEAGLSLVASIDIRAHGGLSALIERRDLLRGIGEERLPLVNGVERLPGEGLGRDRLGPRVPDDGDDRDNDHRQREDDT